MLNNRQLRFIDEYMVDFNASAAYVRAGYSANNPDGNSYKLLKVKEISDEIKARQEKLSKKYDVSRESLIQDLVDIKNSNKDTNPQVTIKAIDTINKMMGYDKPEEVKEEEKTSSIEIKIIKNK